MKEKQCENIEIIKIKKKVMVERPEGGYGRKVKIENKKKIMI